MFPLCDSPRPMDMSLYQQLQQLSPPSPKPDQSSSFFYYPCSPPFAGAGADVSSSSHLSYHQLGIAAASTAPPAAIISPELSMHPSMEQPPAPPKLHPGNAPGAGGVISPDAASAVAASRKDRHSKICTAGGMRDRRMRLSLDVARKFFALQDMLGFDKASKTVQWLLNTSKAAIQEIMTDDALSECVEDGSSSLSVDGGKHNNPAEVLGGGGEQQEKGTRCSQGKKPAKARKATATQKSPRKSGNAHPVVDKEARAKARERARERTKEKRQMRWVKLSSAIDVEGAAAGRDRPSTNNLGHSPTMNAASAVAKLEERSSSASNNGGRTQEVPMASLQPSDMILAFGSNYYCQEQWELGGVVFANSRFY